jgi:hypothetical protein
MARTATPLPCAFTIVAGATVGALAGAEGAGAADEDALGTDHVWTGAEAAGTGSCACAACVTATVAMMADTRVTRRSKFICR